MRLRTRMRAVTRAVIGILERALLGAAMSVALVVVERRLNRMKGRRGARPAPGAPGGRAPGRPSDAARSAR
jgi:hypothetical protein